MLNRKPAVVAIGLGLLVGLSATNAKAGGASYDLVVDAFAPEACFGTGCWTNHLRMTDFSDDGELDIIFVNYPDFFGGSDSPQPLVFYSNNGSGVMTNVSTAAVGDFEGNLRQIAVGDIDDDGDLDIYGPDGAGLAHVLFINNGSGVFVDEADARLPNSFPSGAATRMGDLDNDGDLDIFVADGYADFAATEFGHVYENDGDGSFTEIAGAVPTSISGIDIDDCELLDVDRDWDLDIWVNAHNGGIGALWINDGDASFTAAALPAVGSSNHYNVAPCDVDGDDDLDIWIDNVTMGCAFGPCDEVLLINDGNGGFTDETSTRVTGNDSGFDDNGVACADVDNDGDMDAIVISLGSPERFLENDGDGNFTFISGIFPTPSNSSLWGEFGDVNGDARIDFVTGQGEGGSSDTLYLANVGVPPDTRDPVINLVEEIEGTLAADDEPVVRFAVTDHTVTDEGPRLDRAYAVIDPDGAADEVDAVFSGGDVFRVVLPAQPLGGEIEFRACAEDRHGNVGCSALQTYQVEGDGGTGTESGTDSGSSSESDSEGMTDSSTDDNGTVDTTASTTSDGTASGTASATGTMSGTSADGTDSSGEGDSSGGTGQDDDGGGGCACQSTGTAPSAAFLVLLSAALRRRRR